MNPEIMKIYRRWYDRLDVQYEMIKHLRNRETVFISKDVNQSPPSLRMCKIHSTQHLQLYLKCFPYRLNYPYNLYYSVAKYEKGIPNQDLNFINKSNSIENLEWKNNHFESMNCYDFVIDVDAPSHKDIEEAKQTAIKLHRLFLFHNVPHEIRFSGMGFHFIIINNGTFITTPNHEYSVYKQYIKIAKYLYSTVSELIDLKIYDSRRVIKVPYSLSIYDEEIFICLPILSTDDLLLFSLDENLLIHNSNKSFRGRGIKLFCPDGEFDNLKKIIKW